MPKRALVTGAGVRLGRAIAIGLAEDGYDVAVHYNRSAEEASETRAAIEGKTGQTATLVQADLSDPDGVARLAREVTVSGDGLEVLVNSASTYLQRRLEDVSAVAWDHVMAVNARAPFLLTSALHPLLDATGGTVINMVDLSALRPWRSYADHAVSKAALLHLTRAQAQAYAPRVRVNAIAPGNVLPPADATAEETEAFRQRVPLGRIGTPDDIVEAVRFLRDAHYMTGEVVVVDGGLSLNHLGGSA